MSAPFYPQSKQTYLTDITTRIAQAGSGDQITLMTMLYDPADPMIAGLTNALCKAAANGAQVLLIVDAHIFLRRIYGPFAIPGKLFWSRNFNDRNRSTDPVLLALQRIEEAGGRTAILNVPDRRFTNPFGRRSHIKFTLINDQVYIGGCNLQSHDEIDVMVGWHDPHIANYLRDITNKLHATPRTNIVFDVIDTNLIVDEASTLFIDSGTPGQSLIYDEALKLIDEARESIFITCQFFPSGIARHLEAAHKRGAKVTIVYNNPDKDHWPNKFIHRAFLDIEHLRRPSSFFERELPRKMPYLHAKIIATESAAFVGSHNYLRTGVNWGTAEIALLRRDPAFAQSLIDNIEEQIKNH